MEVLLGTSKNFTGQNFYFKILPADQKPVW